LIKRDIIRLFFFKDIQPVATMVEVKALIDPRLLVEIEAEANVSSE
jgi:enamine deaminase RidA (YjgF/YER057c/UK114 family)